MADFRGAEVYTLEGKRVGKIKEVNTSYFTALNRGILTDEEFRIPMSAVSAVESHDDATIIRLSMSEEQVKHGYEFTKGRPNSEFASGAAESEPKIPLEKQVIHYESSQPAEASRIPDRPPAVSEYLCDMCNEKFDSSSKLQEHRAAQHKAPTGI